MEEIRRASLSSTSEPHVRTTNATMVDNHAIPDDEQTPPTSGDDHVVDEEQFVLHWKERLVIVSLMVISFFTSFETTAIGPPLDVRIFPSFKTEEVCPWRVC